MNYQYSYLLADIFFLMIWMIVFFLRKDIRKEMLTISFIFIIVGVPAELVYVLDWWHPLTITLTKIGIEDFIFSFTIAGISSVIYEEVFKKRMKIKNFNKKRKLNENGIFLIIIISLVLTFFGSFFILGINSFYASIFSLLIPTIYIWIKRKDLIINSIFSGFLLVIVSLLVFNLTEAITPGWVTTIWDFKNLSGIIILSAPIEDLIWFFLAGVFIGPLYEFWKEAKLK